MSERETKDAPDVPVTPADQRHASDPSHLITVTVARALLDRLDALAARQQRTRNVLIGEALAAWAARNEETGRR